MYMIVMNINMYENVTQDRNSKPDQPIYVCHQPHFGHRVILLVEKTNNVKLPSKVLHKIHIDFLVKFIC